ncbi:MAG: phosphatase [Geobacteraceae bacterium GWC2_58_44]|nr:MAG: phosphatase [Geobacteraceae bacterium GWC2_58_44]HBG07568.1 phosphatase [Geobacter sp.]
MKIIADLHTHTLASGHAYSTVNELASAAAQAGLQALALTDHGPALPGGPHRYHFCAMRFIPGTIAGVRIFRGVEANILDENGTLDLDQPVLEELDFVMAGLHENCGFCDSDNDIDLNTRALLAVMENPRVKCISHPGNPLFPLHYEEVAKRGLATGTALEINNSSLSSLSRKGSCDNCAEIARLCARIGTPIMIGSDAHISQGVGVFDDALKLVAEAGIAEKQVINASMERLLSFLGLAE